MHDIEHSRTGLDPSNEAGKVESLTARQTKSIVDVISAAKARLEDEVEDSQIAPAIPEPKSLDRRYLHKLRMLTVSMWILVTTVVLLALFISTAPLHLDRHSRAYSWAGTILGISHITLGILSVATCAAMLARNSLLRTGRS